MLGVKLIRRFLNLITLTCFSTLSASSLSAATLQISELEDVEFGEVSTSATRVWQRMRFCVSMTPAGSYQLTAYGTSSVNSFALQDLDGVAAPIRFELSVGAGRRGQLMSPGIPVRNLRAGRPRRDGSCRGVGQVRLQVRINEQDLAAAAVGRYQGQLQLTVAPE